MWKDLFGSCMGKCPLYSKGTFLYLMKRTLLMLGELAILTVVFCGWTAEGSATRLLCFLPLNGDKAIITEVVEVMKIGLCWLSLNSFVHFVIRYCVSKEDLVMEK